LPKGKDLIARKLIIAQMQALWLAYPEFSDEEQPGKDRRGTF